MAGAILETDIAMYPVANSLHACPARLYRSKLLPRHIRKRVRKAETAGQRINEYFVRQLFHWKLRRVRRNFISQPRNLNGCVITDDLLARRYHHTPARIAIHTPVRMK